MSGKKQAARRKKQNRVLKTVVIVLLIILMLSIAVSGAFFYLFGNLNTVSFTNDDEELGVREEVSVGGITNIALFGVDTRNTGEDSGRSDTIIILTLDQDKNIIKMTSILRDSKVPVDGHGETKINAAYAYGGPTLAIKTLNETFDLDIKEYITVNFSQLATIINAVGGVTLTLSQAEVDMANSITAQYFPSAATISSTGGEITLTGEQAVSYSRIRKLDSDNARATRQQKVLSAAFGKIQSMSKTDYPSFIRQFLGTAETSLSYSEILALSPIALTDFSIEQYTVPDAAYETDLWGGIDSDGVWYYIYNLDEAAKRIHTAIYGDDAFTGATGESTSGTE